MEIEIKVVSTEIIKPSSPTPKYLQKHQFSFIDQLLPSSYMIPLVYFYSSDPKIPNFEKTNRLKISLSEILSRFYPLAGSLVNNLYVDCNDSGILFAEAVANCNLSEVIINPDLNKIRKSLFYKLDESQFFFLAVQATYFRCGGLAVGILLSHKMGDGYSLVTFANIWSAASRNGGDDNLLSPKFDCAAYFPPGDIASPADRCTEDLVDKTFTFPAAKIALLQDMYSAAAGRRWRPGRVETLSAYISTRLVLAMGLQADPTKTYLLNMAANLRSRIKAPMLKYQFGNFGWNAVARPRAGDEVAPRKVVTENLRVRNDQLAPEKLCARNVEVNPELCESELMRVRKNEPELMRDRKGELEPELLRRQNAELESALMQLQNDELKPELQFKGPITRLRAKNLQDYFQVLIRKKFEDLEDARCSHNLVNLLTNEDRI